MPFVLKLEKVEQICIDYFYNYSSGTLDISGLLQVLKSIIIEAFRNRKLTFATHKTISSQGPRFNSVLLQGSQAGRALAWNWMSKEVKGGRDFGWRGQIFAKGPGGRAVCSGEIERERGLVYVYLAVKSLPYRGVGGGGGRSHESWQQVFITRCIDVDSRLQREFKEREERD